MTARKLSIAVALAMLVAALWIALYHGEEQHTARRIGFISLTTVDNATLAGFKAGMAELGYREGQEVVYSAAGPAGSISRLDGLIAELLAQRPDLVLVSSTPATLAMKRATQQTALPVVFAPVNDPVGSGVVASLQAPGGNLTGIRLPVSDKRRLQWLKELAPATRRVLVPYTPNDKSALATLAEIREVAPKLGIELVERPIEGTGQLQTLFTAFPKGVDAVFLPRDSTLEAQIALLVRFAKSHRLPLCAPSLAQVEAGALLSFGFVHREIGRQAARLAVQILRGTRPADLPVEAAENYLAVNLRTADEIGLPIPDHILKQASVIVRRQDGP